MICVTRVKVDPGIIYMKTGQTYDDATAQVSPPNATNPSVKWSSSNRKVVDVHPYNGSMLGIGEGTATVYATAQDDSGKKDCCTVVVSKRIPVRRITLSWYNIQLEMNTGFDLPYADISPHNADNQTVRWCSNNPSVATVANGKIRAHSKGSATITAVATDGSGVSASCKVTVYEKIDVSSVTLSTYNKVMHVGESVTLRAEVLPCDATDRRIMWISSDEEIATVNPTSGLVIAQKPGTTTIRAESLDNSGKKGVCTVTVKASIPVDSITFDRTEVRLRPGDRYEIFRVICPSNATDKSLFWSSNNLDVATVSNNGVIRAKSVGSATITASPTGGGSKPVVATCKVLVSDYTPVSSVTVSPSSKTMTVEDSITLHALVCPDNATHKQLMWRSSNKEVATVHGDSGVVFAQGPGTAVIQALTMDGMGVFGSCTVTVKAAVPVRSVRVCPTETSISVGKSACLTATVYPRDASKSSVRWSSDRPDIATVSRTGTATAMVTGRSDGTATITAMTADGGFVSSCRVTVDPLLIYQTRNTEVKWFEDSETAIETIRPDLFSNRMSKNAMIDSIPCINNSCFSQFVTEHHDGSGNFYPITVAERKAFFLDMAKMYFTNDTFKPIITDMIDHFMREKDTNFTGTIEGYNVYKNSDLTKQVRSHPESIEYVNNIKQALDSCLKENCGDIKILQYDPSKRFINDIRRDQPFVKKMTSMKISEPVFNSNSDITTGFTICLDSLHGNKIEILSFHRNGNNYSGTMRVTYYDHFGLDINDMTGNYGFKSLGITQLEGFHQWFILQHWSELEVSVHPKPFITAVDFLVPFSGTI